MAADISRIAQEVKCRGIILLCKRMRESDLLVHLFTKTHGRMMFYAFGALNSRKRFPSGCDPLWHVQFHGEQNNKGGWTLKEVTLVNPFIELTKDVKKFQIASQALQLIYRMTPLEHPNSNLFILLGGFLQTLSQPMETELNSHLLFLFEVKALQYAGMLHLGEMCTQCGGVIGTTVSWMSVRGLVCHTCKPGVRGSHRAFEYQDRVRVKQFLATHNLKVVYDLTQDSAHALSKLRPHVEGVKADYGL